MALPPKLRPTAALAVATALLVALSGALAPACVNVLGVGGYRSSVAELCGLLSDCFPGALADCEAHVSSGLAAADPALVAPWLAAFGDGKCLATCTAGKLCLDKTPVCDEAGAPCTELEDCCGFTEGASACEGGRCCAADGVSCTSADECCSGSCTPVASALADAIGEVKFGCGGQSCQEFGAPCSFPSDCCSLNCNDKGLCDLTCLDASQACALDSDCCSHTCRGGGCACRARMESCDFAEECCTGLCVAGLCAEPDNCLPASFACDPAGSPGCCAGLDCSTESGVCCERAGNACFDPTQCCSGACESGACCSQDGGGCNGDSDCCIGSCHAGTCGCSSADVPCDHPKDCCGQSACYEASCQSCVAVGCHDLCVAGAPLPRANNGVACPATISLACAAEVCDALPYCCCVAWDAACVAAVVALGVNLQSACASEPPCAVAQ